MKRLSILILSFVLISCAVNRLERYDSIQAYPKAMAVALNSYGQLTGGFGFSSGSNLKEAKSAALSTCRKYNPYSFCIIEMENNNYVFNERLNSFYANQKKSSSQQQNQALIYQQQPNQQQRNQARSNCYMSGKSLQGGIAGALDIIGNCNNNPYGNSNANQICNFKHWNGLVIQGDCSQSSIILGNEVYQKIQ